MTVTQYIGTEYGGFPVVLDMINESSRILDIGVGEDVSFAEGLTSRIGCVVHLLDFTPDSIRWFNSEDRGNKLIFEACGVSDHNGTLEMYDSMGVSMRPSWANGTNQTHEYPVKTVKTMINDRGWNGVDLVKMDIEGEEYKVIPDMFKTGVYPAQICVEFHDRFLPDNMKGLHSQTIKLLEEHYDCVARHGNEHCYILRG